MFKGIKLTTLQENVKTFGLAGTAETITASIDTANQVYASTGKMQAKVDSAKMVHAGFVKTSAADPALVATLDPKVSGVKAPEPSVAAPLVKVAPKDVEVKTEAVAKLAVEKIFFATGSSVLDPNSRAILDQVVGTMKNFPAYYLLIEGHTDNVGNAQQNMKLSQDRCDSVKAYLVSKGFSDSQFITRGWGQTKPEASNNTTEGKAQNRRTEFRLVAQKGQW